MPDYLRKITFGEMRETGDRGLLVYCRDYKCNHFIKITPAEADKWPDDLRISDLAPRFVCCAASEAVDRFGPERYSSFRAVPNLNVLVAHGCASP
jgi:hypothetical protein